VVFPAVLPVPDNDQAMLDAGAAGYWGAGGPIHRRDRARHTALVVLALLDPASWRELGMVYVQGNRFAKLFTQGMVLNEVFFPQSPRAGRVEYFNPADVGG